MFEYKIKNMNKEVMKRYKIPTWINSPINKKKLRKQKKNNDNNKKDK